MKKRVIYSLFGDERIFVVDYLKSKHDWDPVFFLESGELGKFSEKNYSNIQFRSMNALSKGRFDLSKIGHPVPIDTKIIEALSKYEFNVLNLMDDSTNWNFSYIERRRFYYEILTYFNTVIHHLKPNLYVSYTWPQSVIDYSLYLLCKHHYSIDFLFLDPVPHLDEYYYSIGNSLEDLSAAFKEKYFSGICRLSSETEKYINNIKSPTATVPVAVGDYYKKAEFRKGFQYRSFVKLIIMFLLGQAFREVPSAWKKNQYPIDSPLSKMNYFDYFWFRERIRRQNKKLYKIYDVFTKKPDLNRKYLYFASQYQPEAVTSPNAGVFEDLFLAMDILSASVPEGWVIYYKEHPSIFIEADMGARTRNLHYYKKVSSYSNIIMVPYNYSTFDLIDHATAVSTVCGTTGWEAIVRGKPSIVFGRCWYSACKSVFMVNTLGEACEAIKKIENGYLPDQKDVAQYAEAVYQSSHAQLIALDDFNNNLKKSPNPVKYEMERIAKAFHKAYKQFYVQ
jgi:hypothetical protein